MIPGWWVLAAFVVGFFAGMLATVLLTVSTRTDNPPPSAGDGAMDEASRAAVAEGKDAHPLQAD